jgi:hypothetical protein
MAFAALTSLLVLHVSNDDQEREQGSEDNPNVNAHVGTSVSRSLGGPGQNSLFVGAQYLARPRIDHVELVAG